jgi:hypothetical protein
MRELYEKVRCSASSATSERPATAGAALCAERSMLFYGAFTGAGLRRTRRTATFQRQGELAEETEPSCATS